MPYGAETDEMPTAFLSLGGAVALRVLFWLTVSNKSALSDLLNSLSHWIYANDSLCNNFGKYSKITSLEKIPHVFLFLVWRLVAPMA